MKIHPNIKFSYNPVAWENEKRSSSFSFGSVVHAGLWHHVFLEKKHTKPQINGILHTKKKFFTRTRGIFQEQKRIMHSKYPHGGETRNKPNKPCGCFWNNPLATSDSEDNGKNDFESSGWHNLRITSPVKVSRTEGIQCYHGENHTLIGIIRMKS